MNTDKTFNLDTGKIFTDFDYYNQVIDFQNQNGMRSFTIKERLLINEATDFYLIQGKIIGEHKIESLAIFA